MIPSNAAARDPFALAVRNYIAARRFAFGPGGALLALSGGADSMVLARVFAALELPFAAAHVNFGLRAADSDADEAFCRAEMAAAGVPFYSKQLDAAAYAKQNGCSVQVAARELRYQWFNELLDEKGFSVLATAHHRDDVAETLLLNLLRGKDFDVLRGIPARRGRVVRPLLFAPKTEILAFAERQGVAWREDASNQKNDYLRNRMRNKIAPELKSIHPDFSGQLAERLELYQMQQAALRPLLERLWAECLSVEEGAARLDLEKLRASPNGELALVYGLETRFGLDANARAEVRKLLGARPGKFVETPGLRVMRGRGELLFAKQAVAPEPVVIRIDELPQTVSFGAFALAFSLLPPEEADLRKASAQNAFMDADALAGPELTLRVWQPGEKYRPLGMNGEKKISRLLTDLKFPPERKRQAYVLADSEGIIFAEGGRPAERVRITRQTRRVLRVETQAASKH